MKNNNKIGYLKWSPHCTWLYWLLTLLLSTLPAPNANARSLDGETALTSAHRVLVVGDSLSAEYGIARGSGWVNLLDQHIRSAGYSAIMINASISGETTSGGKSRFLGLVQQHRPSIVLLELGANDALRGLSLELTHNNLLSLIQTSVAHKAQVLLLGMQVPPNYGRTYAERFAAIYPLLAQSEQVKLVPFLLKGVADDPTLAKDLFQADGIHPSQKAQALIMQNVWQGLESLLKAKPSIAAPAKPLSP